MGKVGPELSTAERAEVGEEARQAAVAYARRGWFPVALRLAPAAERKALAYAEGNKARHTPEQADQVWSRPANVGVVLGPSGLFDVDLDVPEAVRLAPYFLPPTAVFGRPGAPMSHWLYAADGAPGTREPFADGAGEGQVMLVELRTGQNHTVFPPSVHVSGERVTWQSASGEPCPPPQELPRITRGELGRRVALLAQAVFLYRRRGGDEERGGADVTAWVTTGQEPDDLTDEERERLAVLGRSLKASKPKAALSRPHAVAAGGDWREEVRARGVVAVAAALGLEPQADTRGESFVCPQCEKRLRHTRDPRDRRLSALVVHDGAGWWCEPCESAGNPATGDAVTLLVLAVCKRRPPLGAEDWRRVEAAAVGYGLARVRP